MKKIKEILDTVEDEFTMEEFWAVIDELPDDDSNKVNINKFFKKDGSPKAKAASLTSQKDYQDEADVLNFLGTSVSTQIHLNKLRLHVAVHLQHIQDVKAGKSERMKIVKYGKLEKFKRDKERKENDKKE